MLFSMFLPVSRFFILVRVKAEPLPGLTNWRSITTYGCPSMRSLVPGLISETSMVDMATGFSSLRAASQLPGARQRQPQHQRDCNVDAHAGPDLRTNHTCQARVRIGD